jgi:hypothetical protein
MPYGIAKKCLEARMDNNHHVGELTHQADTEKQRIMWWVSINSLWLDWIVMAYLLIIW